MRTLGELIADIEKTTPAGRVFAFAGTAFYMWVLGRRRRELLELLEVRAHQLYENPPREGG